MEYKTRNIDQRVERQLALRGGKNHSLKGGSLVTFGTTDDSML